MRTTIAVLDIATEYARLDIALSKQFHTQQTVVWHGDIQLGIEIPSTLHIGIYHNDILFDYGSINLSDVPIASSISLRSHSPRTDTIGDIYTVMWGKVGRKTVAVKRRILNNNTMVAGIP